MQESSFSQSFFGGGKLSPLARGDKRDRRRQKFNAIVTVWTVPGGTFV